MADVLFVTGMHRSGTSAFAGSTKLVGARHPSRLFEADESNARGYFESKRVVALNDEALRRMGRTWNDCRPMPELDPAARDALIGEIETTLHGELGESHQILVLKDPRISLLSRFWGKALRNMGHRPVFAIMLRNPEASAASLVKRDGLSDEASLAIWLRYMLRAELDTRDYPRAIVLVENFLSDPVETLRHLQDRIPISWPVDPRDRRAEIQAFVDKDMLSAPLDLQADVTGLARRAYALFRRLSETPYDRFIQEELDRIREELNRRSDCIHSRMSIDQLMKALDRKQKLDRLARFSHRDPIDPIKALQKAYRQPLHPIICYAKHLFYLGVSKLVGGFAPRVAARAKQKADKYDPDRFSLISRP